MSQLISVLTFIKERVRVAGVDTPEKRTRDLEEKELGIHATNWISKKNWKGYFWR